MSIIHVLVDFSKLEKKEKKNPQEGENAMEKANQSGKACEGSERERATKWI